jgi:hypothetical protein
MLVPHLPFATNAHRVLAAFVLAPGSEQQSARGVDAGPKVATNGADRRIARCSYRPDSKRVRPGLRAPAFLLSPATVALSRPGDHACPRCRTSGLPGTRSRGPSHHGGRLTLVPAQGAPSNTQRVSWTPLWDVVSNAAGLPASLCLSSGAAWDRGRCRGPHPAGGEAVAAAQRGAQSRRHRRLRLGYAPSWCGHPSPHRDGASLLGGSGGTRSCSNSRQWRRSDSPARFKGAGSNAPASRSRALRDIQGSVGLTRFVQEGAPKKASSLPTTAHHPKRVTGRS